jgi:pyruvate kinase
MLAKIAAAAEPHRPRQGFKGGPLNRNRDAPVNVTELIALSVETALESIFPAAIFVPTRSGATARSIACFKPPVWIVGVSSQETTCQRLLFSGGVYPMYESDHPKEWNLYVRDWLRNHEVDGNLAILTEGPSARNPDANHRMEIIRLRGKKG